MMKRATALLVLLALCGLLPAAAQEPQEEMKAKAVNMADEAKKMADEAEGMVDEAEGMVEKAEKMMEGDGPGLDEILASHYEALGGTGAWDAVESVRFEGTMSMGPGMEAPFKMTMKRPDNIRLEFTFQGMTGIQASDGTTAWMVMPFMGKNDPEEMPADMAKQLKEQADIKGPLFDWADKGHEVELLGAEEMEGTEVYKIKLTRDSGDVRYHYLDTEYYVTVKQEGKTKVQGQEMEIETAIGDYKELCLATSVEVSDETPCEGDVLVLPHSIESKPKGAPAGQTITITSVEVNTGDIEEEYFAMPAKAADETEMADEAEKADESDG
jgi:hypothetical protein